MVSGHQPRASSAAPTLPTTGSGVKAACEHEFSYAGVRYCDGSWPLPGGSARQRYYAHVYFCSKCTETKGEPIDDTGSYGRPRFDTFQKLEFGAVPGSPDQCGVPQRDR